MRKSKNRWIIKNPTEHVNDLILELGVPELVAKVLVNRGITDIEEAKRFIGITDSSFHDPFLFHDMEEVIFRIGDAIDNGEKIVVFGDYDADGVTSTSIVMLTLQKMGAENIDFYIPNRFTEGYGPNRNAIKKLHDEGTHLIISVDNGIAAHEEIAYANELGIDFIITDHHHVGETLPEAFGIIHPELPDGEYPFHYLAGAGVALKLSQALLEEIDDDILALATIGTIADLVVLKDENRHLVKQGLEAIKRSNFPGIVALAQTAKVDLNEVDETTIGFAFGPRINAAGRLEDASIAVHLFMSEVLEEALEIANQLEAMNRKRQNIVADITQEAIQLVETQYPTSEYPFILLAKSDWHVGVVGIVASKLVDKFNCPAVVLGESKEPGLFKGSARSISGFDIYEAFSNVESHLHHFGGHPMAAGLGITSENLDDARKALCDFYKSNFDTQNIQKEIEIDALLKIKHITVGVINELSKVAPFGSGNPEPKVMLEGVTIKNMKRIGAKMNHLKAEAVQGDGEIGIVGFGFGEDADNISANATVSLVGKLEVNVWRDVQKTQLMLEDLSCADVQIFDCRSKQITEANMFAVAEPKRLIVFEESSKKYLPQILHSRVELAEGVATFRTDENVFIIDSPSSDKQLENLLSGKAFSRLYLFLKQDNREYFREMPTREQFKQMYAFLLKNGPLNANSLCMTKSGINETRKTILEVFRDLEFVKIENGIVSVVPEAPKRDLTSSEVYKQKEALYALESKIQFSSSKELHEFIKNII